jgi:uncharacterized coiled-coil DUF342 family protein
MTIRNSRPTRREITERVSDARREMRDIEDEADIVADDYETTNHTLDHLDGGGTLEGVDEVVQRIESARDATEHVFETKDEQLERTQDTAMSDKSEVDERLTSSSSDQRKILDANDRIRTRETLQEIGRAGDSIQREIDFLSDTIQDAIANLSESESIQQALRSRVYGGKGK